MIKWLHFLNIAAIFCVFVSILIHMTEHKIDAKIIKSGPGFIDTSQISHSTKHSVLKAVALKGTKLTYSVVTTSSIALEDKKITDHTKKTKTVKTSKTKAMKKNKKKEDELEINCDEGITEYEIAKDYETTYPHAIGPILKDDMIKKMETRMNETINTTQSSVNVTTAFKQTNFESNPTTLTNRYETNTADRTIYDAINNGTRKEDDLKFIPTTKFLISNITLFENYTDKSSANNFQSAVIKDQNDTSKLPFNSNMTSWRISNIAFDKNITPVLMNVPTNSYLLSNTIEFTEISTMKCNETIMNSYQLKSNANLISNSSDNNIRLPVGNLTIIINTPLKYSKINTTTLSQLKKNYLKQMIDLQQNLMNQSIINQNTALLTKSNSPVLTKSSNLNSNEMLLSKYLLVYPKIQNYPKPLFLYNDSISSLINLKSNTNKLLLPLNYLRMNRSIRSITDTKESSLAKMNLFNLTNMTRNNKCREKNDDNIIYKDESMNLSKLINNKFFTRSKSADKFRFTNYTLPYTGNTFTIPCHVPWYIHKKNCMRNYYQPVRKRNILGDKIVSNLRGKYNGETFMVNRKISKTNMNKILQLLANDKLGNFSNINASIKNKNFNTSNIGEQYLPIYLNITKLKAKIPYKVEVQINVTEVPETKFENELIMSNNEINSKCQSVSTTENITSNTTVLNTETESTSTNNTTKTEEITKILSTVNDKNNISTTTSTSRSETTCTSNTLNQTSTSEITQTSIPSSMPILLNQTSNLEITSIPITLNQIPNSEISYTSTAGSSSNICNQTSNSVIASTSISSVVNSKTQTTNDTSTSLSITSSDQLDHETTIKINLTEIPNNICVPNNDIKTMDYDEIMKKNITDVLNNDIVFNDNETRTCDLCPSIFEIPDTTAQSLKSTTIPIVDVNGMTTTANTLKATTQCPTTTNESGSTIKFITSASTRTTECITTSTESMSITPTTEFMKTTQKCVNMSSTLFTNATSTKFTDATILTNTTSPTKFTNATTPTILTNTTTPTTFTNASSSTIFTDVTTQTTFTNTTTSTTLTNMTTPAKFTNATTPTGCGTTKLSTTFLNESLSETTITGKELPNFSSTITSTNKIYLNKSSTTINSKFQSTESFETIGSTTKNCATLTIPTVGLPHNTEINNDSINCPLFSNLTIHNITNILLIGSDYDKINIKVSLTTSKPPSIEGNPYFGKLNIIRPKYRRKINKQMFVNGSNRIYGPYKCFNVNKTLKNVRRVLIPEDIISVVHPNEVVFYSRSHLNDDSNRLEPKYIIHHKFSGDENFNNKNLINFDNKMIYLKLKEQYFDKNNKKNLVNFLPKKQVLHKKISHAFKTNDKYVKVSGNKISSSKGNLKKYVVQNDTYFIPQVFINKSNEHEVNLLRSLLKGQKNVVGLKDQIDIKNLSNRKFVFEKNIISYLKDMKVSPLNIYEVKKNELLKNKFPELKSVDIDNSHSKMELAVTEPINISNTLTMEKFKGINPNLLQFQTSLPELNLVTDTKSQNEEHQTISIKNHFFNKLHERSLNNNRSFKYIKKITKKSSQQQRVLSYTKPSMNLINIKLSPDLKQNESSSEVNYHLTTIKSKQQTDKPEWTRPKALTKNASINQSNHKKRLQTTLYYKQMTIKSNKIATKNDQETSRRSITNQSNLFKAKQQNLCHYKNANTFVSRFTKSILPSTLLSSKKLSSVISKNQNKFSQKSLQIKNKQEIKSNLKSLKLYNLNVEDTSKTL